MTEPAHRTVTAAAGRVIDLQRSAGNSAVTQLIGSRTVQRHVGPTSPGEVMEPGTGTGTTGPDYNSMATRIQSAIDGLGTDEAAIFRTLEECQRDATRITALRTAYVALTGRALDADLRGDLSGGELARAVRLLTPKSRAELVREAMLTTASGIWALVVIAVHGVEVEWSYTGQGSYHQAGKIFLNKDLPVDAAAVVMMHEAQHALTYKTGAGADVDALTRAAYVTAKIADEAEAVVRQIEGAAPMQRAGRDISAGISPGLITQYENALSTEVTRLRTADPTLSVAEARTRARTTVRDGLVTNWFHDGTFVTSTGHISYADHYGNFWDSRHAPPASPAPTDTLSMTAQHPVAS